MEAVEDVVIVGAGLAGVATALGLHRKGVTSLVLESSESLRSAGFALATWTNAWRALDALGVGDSLRQQHVQLKGMVASSASSGATTASLSFMAPAKCGEHEVRCSKRNLLLETLEKELPRGTIRYSSKVVAIEESGNLKVLYLADGSILKTKVLIGCDGVNSVVAKWLGFERPLFSSRSACRGLAEFPDGHGFGQQCLQWSGEGFRFGVWPCDERTVYWFFTWTATIQDKEVEESAEKMRQFVLSKLNHAKVPEGALEVVERAERSGVVSSPLRFRWPFDLLWGNISKGNVAVAGDALHPMTPDLGQGGCSALEDSIVLARCLGEALSGENDGGSKLEHERINKALEKYAKERRWRCFELVATAYVVGFIQQSNYTIIGFFRDKLLSGVMTRMLLKKADFDCGEL